jgi:hypothetical protein
MKKLLYLLLVAGLSACQPKLMGQKPHVAARPSTTGDTLPDIQIPVWHDYIVRDDVASIPVTAPAEIARFFQQHNLTSTLQTATGSKGDYALNGFRGKVKYRTEVVVQQVRQDSHNPAVYYLAGLSRTRWQITPFQGQVTLETLSREPLPTEADQAYVKEWSMSVLSIGSVRNPDNEPVARYAVGGRVTLQERGEKGISQIFTGTLVAELALTKGGKIVLNNPFLHGPSQGGGLKYEGSWVPSRGSRVQPAVWVSSIIGYSPNIFGDLTIGEREFDFNPKYAKLGWNTYWENDEWWADSPQPKFDL